MKLIINADDFGMRVDVTDAIVESMAKGYITETTLMVNMPDADRAVALARENGFADKVGLHLNLTEGVPLTEAIKKEPLFCNEHGIFRGSWSQSLRPFPKRTASAVREEIVAQIEKFLSYKLTMMHIDGHNHIHHYWPVLYILRPLLRKYGFKTMRRTWWLKCVRDFKPHFRSRFNNLWFGFQAMLAGVRVVDSFWSGFGFMKAFSHLVPNQVCEAMLHPRYNSRGELIDTHDFDRNEGTPCGEVAQVVRNRNDIEIGTYCDFVK